MKSGRALVEYNEDDDEYYLVSEVFEQLGWETGDIIQWNINEDGTIVIKKVSDES